MALRKTNPIAEEDMTDGLRLPLEVGGGFSSASKAVGRKNWPFEGGRGD